VKSVVNSNYKQNESGNQWQFCLQIENKCRSDYSLSGKALKIVWLFMNFSTLAQKSVHVSYGLFIVIVATTILLLFAGVRNTSVLNPGIYNYYFRSALHGKY
jgi:hypothetical protein